MNVILVAMEMRGILSHEETINLFPRLEKLVWHFDLHLAQRVVEQESLANNFEGFSLRKHRVDNLFGFLWTWLHPRRARWDILRHNRASGIDAYSMSPSNTGPVRS